jgi:myosin heavy subunit
MYANLVIFRSPPQCINYANEKLQQKFTNDIFRSVKQEYEFEGIELAEIQYDDNQNVLNLVEGTTGLISVLNEECIRPKGSDSSFVSKVKSMNKGSDCLINKKLFRNSEFGVKHFAGPVVYDANGFVTKNTDTLPLDLLECAKKCSNDIVRLLNDAGLNSKSSKSPSKTPSRRLIRKSSSIVAETVWTKFRNQLVSLMDNLGRTRTRYIRCIKPNTKTKPYLMQHTSTVEQLRCAGVVAAVTISRSAFPNRLEHEEILHRFKSLWPKGEQRLSPVSSSASHPSDEVRRDVDRLLTPALSELETQKDEKIVKAFVIGKTRTYFRAGALEHLEAERLKGLGGHAIEIQRFARGFLARRLAVRIVKSCIVLQCWTRCNRAKREYSQLRENKKAAKIQSLFRMIVIRKAFLRTKAEKLRRQKEAEQSRQQKTAGAAATAAAAVAAAAAQHQSKENGARHAEAELDGDDKGQGIEIEFDPNEPSDDIDKENQFAPELDLEAQDEFENKSIDENSKITSKETMSPLSQDKEGASWLRRHRRLVIVGTLVVVAAIVGIVVGVVLATGGGGGGGGESVGPLKQFLIDNSLGDGTEFDDPESYQSKAYTWLQADPALGGYSEERTLQRYAVACIYYATYAVRTLITDIVNESEEIPPGWKFTTGWLSNQTECDWLGLVCDEGDRVSQIDLVSIVLGVHVGPWY